VSSNESGRTDLIEAMHGVFVTRAQQFASFARLAGAAELPPGVGGCAEYVESLIDAVCGADLAGPEPEAQSAPVPVPKHSGEGGAEAAVWHAVLDLFRKQTQLCNGDRVAPWAAAFYLHGVLVASRAATVELADNVLLDILALLTVLAAHDGPHAVRMRLASLRDGEVDLAVEEALVCELSRVRSLLAGGLQELFRCESALTQWHLCPGYNHSVLRPDLIRACS